MAKPGRNDRCPCGSGKKYKQCCLTADEAAEQKQMAAAQAARDQRDAERRERAHELKADFIARLRGEGTFEDPLDAASNAVIDLVKAGKLDEAEVAARALLASYPEVHDGWDRLGMVQEARGNERPRGGRLLSARARVPRRAPRLRRRRRLGAPLHRPDRQARSTGLRCDLSAHLRSRSTMAPIAAPSATVIKMPAPRPHRERRGLLSPTVRRYECAGCGEAGCPK